MFSFFSPCSGHLPGALAQVPRPPPPGPEIQPRPAGHPRPATVTVPTWPESKWTKLIGLKPVPTSGRWFPSESGSAQGFFPLSAREFFPCHCCPRLTHWGPVLCKAALWQSPFVKIQIKLNWIELNWLWTRHCLWLNKSFATFRRGWTHPDDVSSSSVGLRWPLLEGSGCT